MTVGLFGEEPRTRGRRRTQPGAPPLISYVYTKSIQAGILVPLFPDGWSEGPAGYWDTQNVGSTGSLGPVPPKALIRMQQSSNVIAPLLLREDASAKADFIEFIPGDELCDWLSWQWLSTDQPYCLSIKNVTRATQVAGFGVVASNAEPLPVQAPASVATLEGIDVSGQEELTLVTATTTATAYSLNIWGLITGPTTFGAPAGGVVNNWALIATPVIAGTIFPFANFTTTIALDQKFRRVYVQVNAVTGPLGGWTVDKSFWNDGVAPVNPLTPDLGTVNLTCTAYWEQCRNGNV